MSIDMLPDSWMELLSDELKSQKFLDIKTKLAELKKSGANIFPEEPLIFEAFRLTPPKNVKVVILGQDPYHTPGLANGLAFGVNSGTPRPPSLRNILRELQVDLSREISPTESSLRGWGRQGVLLLNTALTVESGRPGSHSKIGWDFVVDAAITKLAVANSGVVFVLWGEHAKKKRRLIPRLDKLAVLESGHPSPFSVKGFFGCRHFTEANRWLEVFGKAPVDWTKID